MRFAVLRPANTFGSHSRTLAHSSLSLSLPLPSPPPPVDDPSMASIAASHCSLLAARRRCFPLKPAFLQTSSPSSSSALQFCSPHSFPSSTGIGLVHGARETKDRSSFAQTSAVRELVGSLTRTEGLRFAIVVARFNEIVTRPLLEGALDTFRRYSVNEDIDVSIGTKSLLDMPGSDHISAISIVAYCFMAFVMAYFSDKVVWVPGSYELGIVAQKLGKSGKYHAIVCIGAVVRGDTTHYDAVANSAASGILSAGINSGVPCIFAVLTCEDMDQAINRAGGKSGNKGSEAALTAIEMASLFEHHLKH